MNITAMYHFIWGLMKATAAHPTSTLFAPTRYPERTTYKASPIKDGGVASVLATGHVIISRVTRAAS